MGGANRMFSLAVTGIVGTWGRFWAVGLSVALRDTGLADSRFEEGRLASGQLRANWPTCGRFRLVRGGTGHSPTDLPSLTGDESGGGSTDYRTLLETMHVGLKASMERDTRVCGETVSYSADGADTGANGPTKIGCDAEHEGPGGGDAAMSDEWLKTLLEKMDQDRRDGEARQAASVTRIEHLVEGQAAKLDELGRKVEDTRSEIVGQVESVKTEVIGQVENVRTEVIERVENVRGEVIGRVENVRSEVIGQVENVRGEVIGRVENVRSEVIERVENARTEVTSRVENVRSEVIGQVENVRTEVIGQVENVRTEVIERVENVRSEVTSRVENVRGEITGRMDQAYVHFQSASSAAQWASMSTIIGIAAIALAAVVAILGLR